MTLDPRLAEIFPLPSMVAYKRPPNNKQKLMRAKIPANAQRPKVSQVFGLSLYQGSYTEQIQDGH